MKAWITKFTGEYFETKDNILITEAIAVPTPLKPSLKTEEEIKIQKEMYRLLRELAIKNLKPTPTPIPIEP